MLNSQKGVFCLEADWSTNLKRSSSVEPILELLDQQETAKVPHIHRDVATPEELKFFLDKWSQKRYRSHPILYLAFHGDPGRIFLGDQRRSECAVELDTLGSWLV